MQKKHCLHLKNFNLNEQFKGKTVGIFYNLLKFIR